MKDIEKNFAKLDLLKSKLDEHRPLSAGCYRKTNVIISGVLHKPPQFFEVASKMEQ